MDIKSEPGFIQRYNMLIGIINFTLITSILFTIWPFFGFISYGDVFLVIGCFFGLYITFKNRKESQSHIKTGLLVGLVGSVLSLILISILLTIVYAIDIVISFAFIFVNVGIGFIFIGVIMGYIFGYYFRNKEGAPRESSRF